MTPSKRIKLLEERIDELEKKVERLMKITDAVSKTVIRNTISDEDRRILNNLKPIGGNHQ